jgi:predicted secreted Zn-dependent protease
MTKLGKFMISEKTRVTLSIATFCIVIGATSTGAWAISALKGNLEHRLSTIESHEQIHEEEIKDMQILQSATQTSLVRIETDISWIRAELSKGE